MTISVRDLDATVAFYATLGCRPVLEWDDPDGALRIAHLALPDGHLLEVFAYTANARLEIGDPMPVGNALEAVGVKHFGLRVGDLDDAHRRLAERWPGRTTEIQQGRTGIDYFWVADPDGLWVEIVRDERTLDPRTPTYLP